MDASMDAEDKSMAALIRGDRASAREWAERGQLLRDMAMGRIPYVNPDIDPLFPFASPDPGWDDGLEAYNQDA